MHVSDKHFYYGYDLDATSLKYGKITEHSSQGQGGVETSGSSTTVTAIDSSTYPFAGVGAGDIIAFYIPGQAVIERVVDSKTSNQEIELTAAADLSAGAVFEVNHFSIGTGDDNGWHSVREYGAITVHVDWAVKASDGLDISIEGRGGSLGAKNPVVLTSDSLSAAGTAVYNIDEVVSEIRVGVKAAADATGTDSINIWLSGEQHLIR